MDESAVFRLDATHTPGRTLSTDDSTHYLCMIIALHETRRLMSDIDRAIGEWPIHED